MENFIQHLSNQTEFLIIFILALIAVIISIPYFLNQQKRYKSLFRYATQSRKTFFGISCTALIALIVYGLTPYVTPPTNEIAIVLGNTQNTPYPSLSGDISDAIEGTILQHKGDDAFEIADSIKIISAVKEPEVISLDVSELKLKEIGNNNSNAKRNAKINVTAIEKKLAALSPNDNGANYLEGILKARDNVREGSRILVIGSGLSDTGDLNFSKSNILINEEARKKTIDQVREKYGSNHLDNYSIEFYGLGDTTPPQESLSSKHKEIVRAIYNEVARNLGARVKINTKTLVGEAVKTAYVVGTTDTGCGEIGLIFDDNNLKFIGDQATFTDEAAARESLMTIKTIWDKYSDTIEAIQIDGYIAHYPGSDMLSQQRADSVKAALIDFGIPASKLNASGRGFGPYQEDSQNRMVKITITRNNTLCEN